MLSERQTSLLQINSVSTLVPYQGFFSQQPYISKFHIFSTTHLSLKLFLATECSARMLKNAFYFTLTALFRFCS